MIRHGGGGRRAHLSRHPNDPGTPKQTQVQRAVRRDARNGSAGVGPQVDDRGVASVVDAHDGDCVAAAHRHFSLDEGVARYRGVYAALGAG